MDNQRDDSDSADYETGHAGNFPAPQGIVNVPRHEAAQEYVTKDEEDAVIDYNAPISWWVLSTLFPLIAGTFGPLASTFNICALAITWRTTVAPNSPESEGTHISDPAWLLAVNAVSLAIAVVANLFLLGQMTDRISYTRAAPCFISGWYVSSLLLLGLIAATPTHLPLPANTTATYSQAFFYGIFACVIYFILASMLLTTAINMKFRPPPFSHTFKLTMSQRSLMLQTMLFCGYLLAAGAVYSRVEGWDFLDAVYFVNVTLFTIGLGDYHPLTHLGRSLFFPMAIGGILFVGLIIASIRTLVLEAGSCKISARMVEKARHDVLESVDPQTGKVKLSAFRTKQLKPDPSMSELDRRELEFDIMRLVQKKAGRRYQLLALAISGSCFFVLWFLGAVIFWQAEMATGGENWSYFEALYFTYVCLLTIGYGDFYPQTNSGKPAFVFWSLIALPTLTVLIGAIGDTISDAVASFTLWFSRHAPEGLKAFRQAKQAAQKKRNREGEEESAKPPGFMSDDSAGKGDFEDENIAKAVQALGRGEQNNAQQGDKPQSEEEAQALLSAYRLHILMREMQNVIQHLDNQPPRKYTYAEWTWFLKLLYEDEDESKGHRLPWDQTVDVSAPLRRQHEEKWSWLGQESPLMSMEDEPKWVLNRLLEVAQRTSKKRGDYLLKTWKENQGRALPASDS
ncbi:potassium channel-like protein [Exophiala viscosa]|uniref:potassium channel-like protein n=1 Tax=Exophiala viscosa TaxID=2486360 RepID=UPI00219A7BF3|nr:potassium channel-like protein [Exophiala viscosa]